MKDRAIIKFNGGNLAMLCFDCKKIIKTGVDFTQEEIDYALTKGKHLDPQYCKDCEGKKNQK
jgi:hypothetical protein